jgi:hypothetical protein
MRVGTAFNAAGVNRSAGVLDWGGSDGLIAFGSHHMVVVYKPDVRAPAAADLPPSLNGQNAHYLCSQALYNSLNESMSNNIDGFIA